MQDTKYKIYTKKDLDNKKFELKPGNFFVTHGHDFFDVITQIFTVSHWNHAGLVTDAKGTIIELTTKGIKKKHISEYNKEDMYVVDIHMSHDDRMEIVDYAHTMLRRHATYGFLTVVSIAFKILTKSRVVIKLDGTLICSEFVAKALEHGGVIWNKDTSLITPGDLYNQFVNHKHGH